ncbi:MAG: hypothetical protein ACW992_00965, partial [Candidatus Thorarchaeota archaeon]
MFEELNPDNFERLDDILESYIESQSEDSTIDSLRDQLSKGLAEGRVGIFTAVEAGNVAGFVLIGLKSNRVSFLFADQSTEAEKKLFDFAHDRLRAKGGIVRMGGSWISEALMGHAASKGYDRFDRIGMMIEREEMDTVPKADIPKGYGVTPYDSDMRDSIADLIYRSHHGSIDVGVFPEYFGTFETCQQL